MSEVAEHMPVGAREQRKRDAKRHIQHTALDLFDEHGYRNVTVEQVAAAARVSPSSVYRHFGTKEMLVLYDEYDPQFVEMLHGTGDWVTTPDRLIDLAAASAAVLIDNVAGDESHLRKRFRFVTTEPDLRAGLARQTLDTANQIRYAAARRLGRDLNDLQLHVAVNATIWAFQAAVDHWLDNGFAESLADILDRVASPIFANAKELLGGEWQTIQSQPAKGRDET